MPRWLNHPHHSGRSCKKCGSREKYFKGGCVPCTIARVNRRKELLKAGDSMSPYRPRPGYGSRAAYRIFKKPEAAKKKERLYPKLGLGITLDMIMGRR